MERLPGFRDFYPEPLPEAEAWSAELRRFLFEAWRGVARRYGFREYDAPPLEPLELFTLKSGAEIAGQLYSFADKGGREVALRPEITPSLARLVAARERHYKKPIKWFAIPQLFRYERQQKGRLREHFQFNADLVGENDPAADAELVALLIDSLRAVGLTAQDFVVRLSSRQAWQEFYTHRGAEPARALDFFQVVDKLERESPEASDAKLKTLGFTLEEVRAFIAAAQPTADLTRILHNLSARGLSDYTRVDYTIVRGLAYYTGTVFEAHDRRGEFRAIAGGGRYDNLLKLISGGKTDLPAIGFGMGDVVLAELLAARNLRPKFEAGTDAYCVIDDETLRDDSLRLVQDLRNSGLAVEYALTSTSADKQLKRALELGVAHTFKLERLGTGKLLARLRVLATRSERTMLAADLAAALHVDPAAAPQS